MDETDVTAQEYASFLVRLWRCGVPAAGGPSGEWQGEVEHIQSGQRWGFNSLSELWHFLNQQMAEYSQRANSGFASS